MKPCPRCGDKKMHLIDDYGVSEKIVLWSCLGCGEKLDAVILANRNSSKPGLTHGRKPKWERGIEENEI